MVIDTRKIKYKEITENVLNSIMDSYSPPPDTENYEEHRELMRTSFLHDLAELIPVALFNISMEEGPDGAIVAKTEVDSADLAREMAFEWSSCMNVRPIDETKETDLATLKSEFELDLMEAIERGIEKCLVDEAEGQES